MCNKKFNKEYTFFNIRFNIILEYHLSKKNLLEEYITFTLQTEKIFGRRK